MTKVLGNWFNQFDNQTLIEIQIATLEPFESKDKDATSSSLQLRRVIKRARPNFGQILAKINLKLPVDSISFRLACNQLIEYSIS